VPNQTQDITTTGRTLDLWSINKPQMLFGTIIISNSTKAYCYEVPHWYNFKSKTRLPVRLLSQCKLPHLPHQCTPDSALHILSNCQHTNMRNMIIKRHNTASVLIVQALQKKPCGANQIAYTDAGSADKLSEQGQDLRNTANKNCPLGCFQN